MKKLKLVATFCFLMLLSIFNVHAIECQDKSIASDVNIEYETNFESFDNYVPCPNGECSQSDWTETPPRGYYYSIKVTNLTNDMYVEISNGEKTETFDSTKIVDGILTYETTDINSIYNYTVKVYKAEENCILKSSKEKSPMLNKYATSNVDLCKKISDYESCNPWVKKELNDEKFYEGAQKYATSKKVKVDNLIPDVYKKNNDKSNLNTVKKILISLIIVLLIGIIIISIKVWGKSKNEKK